MGQRPRRPLSNLGSSAALLGEVTRHSRTLDISGPRERRPLEPHWVLQRHTQREAESQALRSPLLVLPTACCRQAAALPSPTSCVRPVCGFGLQSASTGCEYTPALPTEEEMGGVQLYVTGAATDPSGLCPCQLRCPQLLCKHPRCPGKPNLPEALGRPLASSLATKPWLQGFLVEMGAPRQRGGGKTGLSSLLLLGNISTLYTSSRVVLTVIYEIANPKS